MPTWPQAAPFVLLLFSNLFMTFAWYGHLKFRGAPIWAAIMVSWGIAFFEYVIAVPANRIGAAVYSPAQLKTIQEAVTLIVFAIFSATYLGEPLSWKAGLGFLLIFAGASLVFFGKA